MASASAILSELERMEERIKRYSATDQFDYSHDGGASDDVRVIYSGKDIPPEVSMLLARDDTRVCSVYTNAPITVKVAIQPKTLPTDD